MLYFITSMPPQAADGKIMRAINAEAFVQSGEIHVKDTTAHYIHKPSADIPGWYMRNPKDETDHFLGVGASPTINADDIIVDNEELWAVIATGEAARAAAASEITEE